MSTQEIASQADFRVRAKTNDVPIARLIGFEAKDIADGRGEICSSRSRRMTTWPYASCQWPTAFWGVPAFHQSEKIGERIPGLAH